MEPQHNSVPSSELPQPVEVGYPSVPEANLAPSPESVASTPPQLAPSQQADVPTYAQPAIPQQLGQAIDPAGGAQSHHSTPMADDADLIEKEWVNRAKAIVQQAKDDPHLQNKEMNKVKADYLKKRYNKDLKLSEN